MIQADKEEHKHLLEQSIQRLVDNGFEDIKADMKGFDSPKTFQKRGSEHVVTPDIVAFKDGRQHYFELSVKSENPSLLKSKWRFLTKLSELKDHEFNIITARGHYKFTNEILRELNLKIKPIKLETF